MSTFPTSNRAVLSWSEVYRAARQGGFSPADAIIATAITQPEAGRQPGVVQSGQPYSKTGWGLWQITPGDSVPSVGVNDALLDPVTNAKAAHAKFVAAGNSFRPWTTYEDGAYRPFLDDAQAAAKSVGDAISGAIGAGVDAAGGGLADNQLGGDVDGNPLQIIDAISGLFATPGDEAVGQVNTKVGGRLSDAAAAAAGIAKGVTSWLSGLVADLEKMLKALLWLVNPANEIRLLLALFGVALFGLGGFLIFREVRHG